MYTLITVLIVIAAILLILAVLIQNPKGGGIASNFSAGNSIMGVKRTTDFIEKLTWGLAIGIIVFSLLSNIDRPTATATDETKKSSVVKQADKDGLVGTAPTPTMDQNNAGDQTPPQDPPADAGTN